MLVRILTLLFFGFAFSGQTSAAWFQAQGQAMIINGDKELARKEATNDAVRQALLFAGAAVSSSQTIVNGLMSEEALHISASGEVKRVEKVNEQWHRDFLTVTIRADIFADSETAQCDATLVNYSLASAHFSVRQPQQLLDGNIQRFGSAIVEQLDQVMTTTSDRLEITTIMPFTLDWQYSRIGEQAQTIGKQFNVQLALFGQIEDASVVRAQQAWYELGDNRTRQFSIQIKLIDTVNGAILLDKFYESQGPWQFDQFHQVDPLSSAFWTSAYGSSVNDTLVKLVNDIEQSIQCLPATGRIISVANNQVNISLGRHHGLRPGDVVTLYQKTDVIDEHGQTYIQYNLHPNKLKAVNVNVDNATLEPETGGLLGNVQPNDFVTIR